MTGDQQGTITVQYWAAAREAAGCASEHCRAATVAEALAIVGERHGERLRAVLARCSFLVDGAPVGRRDPATVQVSPGDVIEVLPPFAGG
jgi:molybdopterin converting factor small subunit